MRKHLKNIVLSCIMVKIIKKKFSTKKISKLNKWGGLNAAGWSEKNLKNYQAGEGRLSATQEYYVIPPLQIFEGGCKTSDAQICIW